MPSLYIYAYDDALYKPWFTGTVVAYPATITAVGKINCQPYLPCQISNGAYTPKWGIEREPIFYALLPFTYLSTGITDNLDVEFTLSVDYNITQNKQYLNFGDQSIMLQHLILQQDEKSLKPSIVIAIQETFPTGKYQRLSPEKRLTDWTGYGSFRTLGAIFIEKQFLLSNKHLVNIYFNFFYTYSAKVHVSDFNGYGGGYGTSGVVFPGNQAIFVLSGEYQISQNWVFGIDSVYIHNNRDHFKGYLGVTAIGEVAVVGHPSAEQFSLAPSLEYNFNENLGVFGGVWFTYAGRNATVFATPLVSVNMSF